MTVTEPEATVTKQAPSNGVAPDPHTDGIDYLDDGTIRFIIDGLPYTLRRPKLGTFRALHLMWSSAVGMNAQDVLTVTIDVIRAMFNGDDGRGIRALSDRPLTDDVDEWPTWLGVGSWVGKAMIHFRDVPLARGGSVTE